MNGSTAFFVLLGLAVAGALFWAVRVWRRAGPSGAPGRIRRMRREYERLTGLRGAQAYDSLERQLERQMKRNPGQPMELYLEAVLKELKRDKR